MRQRIRWIDILRGVGIVCIVFSHTLQNIGITSQILYAFHVPLFFFASGLTYTDGEKPFFAMLRKKAKRVIVPFFIWGVISLILFLALGEYAESVLNSGRSSTMKTGLILLLKGHSDGNSPLWFLPAIFCTSVLMWGAQRLLSLAGGSKMRAVLMALPFILSVGLSFFIVNDRFLYGIWSADDAIILFFFCWGGYVFREKLEKIHPLIGLALFAAGCALGATMNDRIIYAISEYRRLPVFYLAASFAVIGLSAACRAIPHFRAAEYVGRNTMPILVMHKFPVMFFQVVCPVVKDFWAARSMPWMIAIAIASVAMCCAAGEIIRKFIPILIGESNTRQ